MSEKKAKPKQWLIDRAFNLNEQNKTRLDSILFCCNQVKNNKISEDEAKRLIVEKKGAPSIERYLQSTATAMRSYGFIQTSFCTTEISDKYLAGELLYNQFVLFQIIKKEFKYDDDSEIVKPLYILLSVCMCLLEKGEEYCWIDAYDYQNYLTEIKSNSEIYEYAEKMFNDKKNSVDRSLEYKINHFDIWCNALITTKLFIPLNEKQKYCIKLNLKKIDLIKFIIENYYLDEIYNSYKIPAGTGEEKIKNLANLGKVNSSIFLMLPDIKINKTNKLENLSTADDKILYYYLIEGKSFREIDNLVLKCDYDTKGFFSKMIISGRYGIEGNEYKGIWKPFKDDLQFIQYSPKYKKSIPQVINTLFGGDNMESKKVLRERQPRKNSLYPFNRIIYGAPGTGKTYSTAELAIAVIENNTLDDVKKAYSDRKTLMDVYRKYTDEGKIIFTTFHQSYGYEDFIQGLRPVSNENNLSFKLVDGVLKKIAERALNDDNNDYVIIIDEINRGNISKIFGELITIIEDDKRWGEINQMSVVLPSGEVFAVPNNLYIIGTMNSADKSISLIDAALRRRFEFIEQRPDADLINDTKLKQVFITLNTILAKELDSSDLLIGHSYFISKTIDDLANILNHNIIPLLYEYFFDSRKKINNLLSEVLKDTDLKINDDSNGRITVSK